MGQLSLVVDDKTEVVDTWECFWVLYPRRQAKKDALKAWNAIDPAEHVRIITALAEWRKFWRGKDLQYIPLPATWIRGERWEDELPVSTVPVAAAHMPAKLPLSGDRTEMPEHVRQLIAKLRRG